MAQSPMSGMSSPRETAGAWRGGRVLDESRYSVCLCTALGSGQPVGHEVPHPCSGSVGRFRGG
eukprot:405164-Alexandrium_andersonii.AAC.1